MVTAGTWYTVRNSISAGREQIFEKIVYARVSNFLNKNKLLTNFQYGFKNNAST